MSEKTKFTTPFAMKCSYEQFDTVKDDLIKMGYILHPYGTDGCHVVTNYGGSNKMFGLDVRSLVSQPLFIEEWNKDLCLALAAMTDSPVGIKGEYWKFIGVSSTERFSVNKMYKQIHNSAARLGAFIDNMECENGFCYFGNRINDRIVKSTAQELIEHFTKEKEAVTEQSKYNNGLSEGFSEKILREISEKLEISLEDILKGIPEEPSLSKYSLLEHSKYLDAHRYYVNICYAGLYKYFQKIQEKENESKQMGFRVDNRNMVSAAKCYNDENFMDTASALRELLRKRHQISLHATFSSDGGVLYFNEQIKNLLGL